MYAPRKSPMPVVDEFTSCQRFIITTLAPSAMIHAITMPSSLVPLALSTTEKAMISGRNMRAQAAVNASHAMMMMLDDARSIFQNT